MAKPRIFVSSTYYDLKHIRASLDVFIDSLGYEAILSEKGSIAYNPEIPLDESCYKEATTADVFVLIIGGRYGSEASSEAKIADRAFHEQYESITKKEYDSAAEKDIPIYILIEAGVYAEYQTYKRNKENTNVVYAHVDSANIFRLIEEILAKQKNNPIRSFERFSEIEVWLRDQWAGLFKHHLTKAVDQKQIATLTSQVEELREVSATLKKYLEALMSGTSKEDSKRLIKAEKARLQEVERRDKVHKNGLYEFLISRLKLSQDQVIDIFTRSKSLKELFELIESVSENKEMAQRLQKITVENEGIFLSVNNIRRSLGAPPFENENPAQAQAESSKKSEPTK